MGRCVIGMKVVQQLVPEHPLQSRIGRQVLIGELTGGCFGLRGFILFDDRQGGHQRPVYSGTFPKAIVELRGRSRWSQGQLQRFGSSLQGTGTQVPGHATQGMCVAFSGRAVP